MHKDFEMSMIGELNLFLGIQISKCFDKVYICKSKYMLGHEVIILGFSSLALNDLDITY